jgi:hypothetical protein
MAKRGQGEGSISRRPDGTWWARVTLGKDENGKQKRKAFYGKTRKEVQEKLTAALNDVNTNSYIEPSNMTVSQWFDIWLKEYKKNMVKLTTYSAYVANVNSYILPHIGQYKLKNMRTDMLQSMFNTIGETDLSRNSVFYVASIVKGAFSKAAEDGLISKDISKGIQIPGRVSTVREVLTPEEQERFVKTAMCESFGELFVFLLGTGRLADR